MSGINPNSNNIIDFFFNTQGSTRKADKSRVTADKEDSNSPTLEEMRVMSMMKIMKKYGSDPDLFSNHLYNIVVRQNNRPFAKEMYDFLNKKIVDILNETTANQARKLINIAKDLIQDESQTE